MFYAPILFYHVEFTKRFIFTPALKGFTVSQVGDKCLGSWDTVQGVRTECRGVEVSREAPLQLDFSGREQWWHRGCRVQGKAT